jgi:hypothetical protein
MKTPVIFKYSLPKPGIASGNIEVNGQSVEFEVANTGNPLADLLRGMVSLIFEPSHIWDEENIQWIDWYGISKSFKWIFSTDDGESINIKVIEHTDLFDNSTAVTKISEKCNLADFYLAITQELDIFIRKTGLLNYEQKWQNEEFPLTYFLILKKHLLEKGIWKSPTHKPEILNDEVNILLL